MYKVLLPIMLAAACWAIPSPSLAADPVPPVSTAPATATPAATSAPAKSGPSNPATDAAEARYRAWVNREHAEDAAEFAKEKNKIEDKYKGYVRPKHDRKQGATAGKTPADKANASPSTGRTADRP